MFKKINKSIKSNPVTRFLRFAADKGARPFSKRLCDDSAQVAIVLIIIIAFALIFYAVTLNLGKISQTKAQITIASNVGAGLLASQMASYGQQKYMVELGGRRKRCGFTLLGRILLIAALVALAVVTGGASLSLTAIVIGSVMAVTAITLDLVVIEPGINELWNKHIGASMDQASGMLESGIRTALQGAVGDQQRVIDEFDTDFDGLYGGTVANPDDEIARFAVYYNKRLESVQGPSPLVIQAFLDALRNLLYEDVDSWGLYDPVNCAFGCCYDSVANPIVPSECNRCCWPLNAILPDGTTEPVRTDCCNPPCTSWLICSQWPPCGVDSSCDDWTPGSNFPGVSPFAAAYQWVYNPFYEDPTNTFFSFREQIGKDDEHRDFNRDLANITLDPVEQYPVTAPAISDFIIEDATGYLNFDPLFGGTGFGLSGIDRRPGIYPFFYKVRDWALELARMDPSTEINNCYWYDPNFEPLCDPVSTPYAPELMNRVLDIVGLGGFVPSTLQCNTTHCVDSTAASCGAPGPLCGTNPLAVDRVFLPEYVVSEHIDPDYCAQHVLYPPSDPVFLTAPDPTRGFWKEGGDRYCSGNWPYEEQCAKAGGWVGNTPPGPCADFDSNGNPTIYRDCLCAEQNGSSSAVLTAPLSGASWPDDPIDDFVYGTNVFIEWAETILPQQASTLAKDLLQWYPEAAEWIEPGTRSGATPMVDCFVCNQDDGYLWQWLFNLQQMRNRLQNMLLENYSGSSCSEVWCGPDSSLPCPLIKQDEAATIGASALQDTTAGVGDVIECLNHNANFVGPLGGVGNDGRFQDCFDACFAAAADPTAPRYPLGFPQDWLDVNTGCGDGVNTFLPRSLIGGFDPSGQFVPADLPNLNPYLSCPDSCTNTNNNGCLDACTSIFGGCTAACDAANIACIAGCGGNPACITICNNAWNTCTSDPVTGCGINETNCRNACVCVINGVTYQCNQAPNALYTALNTDAEAAGYKNTCIQSEFSVALGGTGGGFYDLLEQSIPEATNQVIKFRHRHDFLLARANEINHIINIFDTAITQIDGFLNGAAAALIQERINYSGEALPWEVIYGWTGDRPPGNPSGRGLWHVVKVEGRIPARCGNLCDPTQTRSQPWPNTRTYRRALGTQRCYELEHTDGVVKLRVTRYDENRPSNPILFPSGIRIWDFRSHPDRSAGNFAANLGTVCPPLGGASGPYTGAFLNNGAMSDGTLWNSPLLPSDSGACNAEANRLLTDYGVVSETCARYYDHRGRDEFEGFDFQFLPCGVF